MVRSLAVLALLAADPSAADQPVAAADKGKALYVEMCSACHMPAGTGVPGQQPSLRANKRVMGEPGALIQLLLEGTGSLPADRRRYPNEMPPLESLSDEQIADILTYVRGSFGNKARAVTAAQVAAVRGKK